PLHSPFHSILLSSPLQSSPFLAPTLLCSILDDHPARSPSPACHCCHRCCCCRHSTPLHSLLHSYKKVRPGESCPKSKNFKTPPPFLHRSTASLPPIHPLPIPPSSRILLLCLVLLRLSPRAVSLHGSGYDRHLPLLCRL
ncbi:hypothetical protein B0O80DRAFT_405100, partial [Mortierella sp. GBAus27b]